MRARISGSVLACALVAVLAAAAQPSAPPRTFGTRGDVVRIAANGTHVAAAVAGSPTRCGAIVVFHAATGRFERFEIPSQCPGREVGAIGPNVPALALSDGQVAWMVTGGGNTLEIELRAATLGRKATYQLSFATNGAGAAGEIGGQWLTHLLGSGPLLVYSSFTLCDTFAEIDNCFERPPTPPFEQELVTRPALVGVKLRRQRQLRSDLDSIQPLAVGGGRIALLPLDRRQPLRVVDATGRVVASVRVPNAPAVVLTQLVGHTPYALDGNALVVRRAARLDLFELPSGQQTKTLQLPSAFRNATLVGAASGLVALQRAGKVFVVRTSDGASVSYAVRGARAPGIVDAAITPAGLFYAYNVRSATATGRIQFVPLARVRAGF